MKLVKNTSDLLPNRLPRVNCLVLVALILGSLAPQIAAGEIGTGADDPNRLPRVGT